MSAKRWVGSPQPDQFVRVSTELLVAIARTQLNDREHRLLMAIVAATYGRFSDHVRITRAGLGKLTALTAPQVLKGLSELERRGIIVMGPAERGKPVLLELVKHYGKWESGPAIDLSVEDAFKSLPTGQRADAPEPESEPDQVSLWQLDVSTGKLQVSTGKVEHPANPHESVESDPRRSKKKKRRQDPTVRRHQADRAQRREALDELDPSGHRSQEPGDPAWLTLALHERLADWKRDNDREDSLSGHAPRQIAEVLSWANQRSDAPNGARPLTTGDEPAPSAEPSPPATGSSLSLPTNQPSPTASPTGAR